MSLFNLKEGRTKMRVNSRKFLFVVFVFLPLFISGNSFAGFLLEPYAGGGVGTFNTKSTVGSHTIEWKFNATGGGMGLRAGFSHAPVFAALDFTVLTLKMKQSNVGNADSETGLKTLLGITAGMDLSTFPLRIWGGYCFIDKLENPANNDYHFEGNAFKFGIGLKIFPIISINAEFYRQKFKKSVDSDGNTLQEYPYEFAGTRTEKPVLDLFLISVSLPFNI